VARLENIEDDDLLYRRLPPRSVTLDGRVLRTAYMLNGKPDPEISVNLARLSSPEATAASQRGRGRGAGELATRVPRRDLGLTVVHDPDHEQGNDAQCLIIGATSRSQCQTLADATLARIPPAELAG
jgi:hypothetical protein